MNKKLPGKLAGLLLLATAMLQACDKERVEVPAQYSEAYFGRQAFLIGMDPDLRLYDTALKVLKLRDTLLAEGPYTTVLINNKAFKWGQVDGSTVTGLTLPANASRYLRSMIFSGTPDLAAITPGTEQVWSSLAGTNAYLHKFRINADSSLVAFNGVPFAKTGIPATNGTMQLINANMPEVEQYRSFTDYLQSQPELSYMAVVVQRSGLADMLTAAGSYTLFAPTNDAFKSCPDVTLNSLDKLLAASPERLAALVRYHLAQGRNFLLDYHYSNKGSDTVTYNTLLAGKDIRILYNNATGQPIPTAFKVFGIGNRTTVPQPAELYTRTFQVFVFNQPVGNGVVHEINRVLLAER